MSDVIPHFKYHYVDISGRRLLRIEAEGKIFHEVENLNEFYQVFGYRIDPAQQPDLLPDEFIWAEYVNDPKSDLSSCIQVHIIEYLNTHSDCFRKEFGGHFERWMANHANIRAKQGKSCIACRFNPDKK